MSALAPGLLRLLSLLPLPVAHLCGWLLGLVLYLIPNTHRHISRTNLELCFADKSWLQRQWLLLTTLVETAKTLFETPIIWLCSASRFDRLIHNIAGTELIDTALQQQKGVLVIGPHLGSWELVSLYCSKRYNITSLYRPLRYPALELCVRTGRERFGASLVPTSARGVKALFQALAQNRFVGIPPDQDPRANGGVFAPFFGLDANTMTLLPRLYQKSSATPILAVAQRLGFGRGFSMRFIAIDGLEPSQSTEKIATQINIAVEKAIRQIPSQYQWSYKRFRTRPQGEHSFY